MPVFMLLCLALMSLLAGCAPTVWLKSGATQQDFNRESYECERDARQSGYFGTGLAGALNMQAFQERCMVAKGWSKQQTAATRAPDPLLDARMQIYYDCVEQSPAAEMAQCLRDEAARRGLPPSQ